jgi:PIN domain nuclease of toxin-antitoxin system
MLSERALAAIDQSGAVVFVSVASIWELSIKIGKGKLVLEDGLDRLIENIANEGWQFCPISVDESAAAGILPPHHNDPFDRMLIAQCNLRGYSLVSVDAVLDQYGVVRIW